MHPSGVAESSTSFGWGKGGNVTSAGWQVTLCDPVAVWQPCDLLYVTESMVTIETPFCGYNTT